jgi:ribonuclease Z
LEIIFIGTGSGKTSLNRNHSSLLISSSDTKLLVDAGDGISKALLQTEINYNSITDILITHYHPDHLSGLPSLLNQMKMNHRKNSLNIFCPGKPEFLKNYIETNLIFIKRIGFIVEFISLSETEIKLTGEISFRTKQNSHLLKYGDEIKDEANLISFSVLFTLKGKKVFYTGDVGSPDDLYLFNDKFDILISEATHLTTGDIISAIDKLYPEMLILTHLEDDSEFELKEFVESAEKLVPKFVIAYDNYKCKI